MKQFIFEWKGKRYSLHNTENERGIIANIINGLYAIIYISLYFHNRHTQEQQRRIHKCIYIYISYSMHILYTCFKKIVYVNYGAGTVLDFGVKAMDKESPCPNET